jgi:hypothetical protein
MEEVLQKRWNELGDKVVALAREFPEERYEQPPAAGMRSFGEQLRHLAFWNEYAGKTLRGEAADGEANTLPHAGNTTRAEVVSAVERSFGAVSAALAASPDPDVDTAVTFLEHGGEHYGQLAVYYRLHGMVPPASRG